MRILQIFNRYAHVGGEEIAVGRITGELSEHHEFRAITFDSNEWTTRTGLFDRIRQPLLMLWNPASIARVRGQVDEFRPDVILLHNLMPIGSAGLYLYLTRLRTPVIHFIHNFRPFSVSGYCWGGNKLLPQGLKQNFLPEILAGAWQESRFKTAWYGLLIWLLHRAGVFQRIDGWIAISSFMKSAFIEGGIEERRIQVISHSWMPQCTDEEIAAIPPDSSEPMFLFLGRLTEEKGLRVLLDAWKIVEQTSETGRLIIAGDGPLAAEVEQRCAGLRRASWVGFKTGREKQQLLCGTTALVVPSIWWEPLGLVLYEAYDHGKPVLAARSGGIVDHVEDGVTGHLHDPGDFQTLASQILAAITDRESYRAMGAKGRKLLLERSSGVWIQEFDQFAGKFLNGSEQTTPTPSSSEDAIRVQVYLADQNPGHDRSFGISRMSHVVLEELGTTTGVQLHAITSRTSQKAPETVGSVSILPWGTRSRTTRLLTDHLYPLLSGGGGTAQVHYFPKGYLPLLSGLCRPSVVTIHDTIIQYDEDHYPDWRKPREYAYWALILKHTLRHADRIMTVSESSKDQILTFMDRHDIPRKPITVTYEPCMYEGIPQPHAPEKGNFVIHLASTEPHKRTAHLIRWWHEAESRGRNLPMLHLIGTIPREVEPMLASSHSIVKRPFLEDAALQAAYLSARALILPSEIEGFGLPALESYYLGTPVCFIKGTSVEEILRVATEKGGFALDQPDSLFAALDEVMGMSPQEIHDCGLKLRETYAVEKVASAMMRVFEELMTETDLPSAR